MTNPLNNEIIPPEVLPSEPQALGNVPNIEVVNNTAPENTENKGEMAENEQKVENTVENQTPNIEPLETKSELIETSENAIKSITEPTAQVSTQTAQMPANEPLTQDKSIEKEPEIKTEIKPVLESKPEPVETKTEIPKEVIVPAVAVASKNKILELLNKAKLAIQFRKRKKLDKIMTLFLKKSKITNDEVEKFLHVSDATATRYLTILKKENKIKQTGKTGHSVSYSKI